MSEFHVTVPNGSKKGLVRFGSVPVEKAHLVSHALFERIMYGSVGNGGGGGGRGGSESDQGGAESDNENENENGYHDDDNLDGIAGRGRETVSFFSVTRTQFELSFADDSAAGGAARDVMAPFSFPCRHLPGFVSGGDLSLEACGLVSKLSHLLRSQSILYQSTVQTDYLFVAEHAAADALGLLSGTDGVSCSIETGDVNDLSTEPVNLSGDAAAETREDDGSDREPTSWPIAVLPTAVSLYALESELLQACALPIFTTLFSGDRPIGMHDPRRFASLTLTPDEISLVLDPLSASHFPSGSLRAAGHPWAVLRIGGSPPATIPASARGIVAAVSHPLSERGVPMLYVSTAGAGHVLVPLPAVAEAVETLRGAGFSVEEGPE